MMTTLRIIGAETRKGIYISWRYRFNLIMQLLTLSLVFLFMVFFIGQGHVQTGQLATTILGYVTWYFAINMITTVGIDLIGEAQTGTLEQIYMSVSPPGVILVGRAVASLVTTAAQVVLLDIAIVALRGPAIPVSLPGLLVLGITLFGLFGFGLILGGATMVFKNIHALGNLVITVFLFLNGTLLTVDKFPHWLAVFANALPSTQGVSLLREVTLGHHGLGFAWSSGHLGALVVNSLVYFVVGWIAFRVGTGIARRRGSLGQY